MQDTNMIQWVIALMQKRHICLWIVCSLREVREDYPSVAGKQALFLVNLTPRKIMGIESHGMLVTLGYDDGIADTLLFPEHPLPNGTRAS